jgi:hypothetical protein
MVWVVLLRRLKIMRVNGRHFDRGRMTRFRRAKIIALSRRAADQGIVRAVVEAANSLVVISLLVDFEIGAQERLGWKLFDCEPDGVRRVAKSSVPNGSSSGILLATGEQLRRGVIIKFDYGLFDRGVLDRHLFERDFSDHDFILPFGFDVMGLQELGASKSFGASNESCRLQDKPRAPSKSMNRARFSLKIRQRYC